MKLIRRIDKVSYYTIENYYQKVTLITLGAAIYKWETFKDRRNIVITNLNYEDYKNAESGYLSSTIGRVTNRIKGGKFTLNNKTYQLEQNFHGNNHGHGGSKGLFAREFTVLSHEPEKIVFKIDCKQVDDGYPGNVEILVTYELNKNQMIITYDATTEEDTILNITNHAYFNLSNENNILNHNLEVSADYVLETDTNLVPTGKLIDVSNTQFDLRKEKKLRDIILNPVIQIKTNGLDHAFLFNNNLREVVLSYGNKSLKIETSYPGIQIFSGNNLLSQPFLDRKFDYHFGIALEPQYEPDAINHENFNSIILRKKDKYHEKIIYTINET